MTPTPPTYTEQLDGRVAELLPDMNNDARLELLGVMDPDDLRASLAFIATMYPQAFDHGLVRDQALVERLQDRLDHQYDDDPEPYCSTCSASLGIFAGRQAEGWLHYRGEGTAAAPVQIFEAGHEAVVAWREAAEAAPALCESCDVDPATEGRYCSECAPAAAASSEDGAR